MIGVDTNVLVRYIVQDDARQAAAASRLIERRCTPQDPGRIDAVVLCELVWVLETAYGYDKHLVHDVLRRVLTTKELAVDCPDAAWAALREFETGRADFSDYLISHRNHANGCTTTVSFDRTAADAIHLTALDS